MAADQGRAEVNVAGTDASLFDLTYWVRWYERQLDIAERQVAATREHLTAAKARLREALDA